MGNGMGPSLTTTLVDRETGFASLRRTCLCHLPLAIHVVTYAEYFGGMVGSWWSPHGVLAMARNARHRATRPLPRYPSFHQLISFVPKELFCAKTRRSSTARCLRGELVRLHDICTCMCLILGASWRSIYRTLSRRAFSLVLMRKVQEKVKGGGGG